MSDISGLDSIWVGNIGRYNEGSLVGGWIPLPQDPSTIWETIKETAAVNRFHEEVMIFDTNLEGPMGDMGVRVEELTDIDDLNLLAAVIDSTGVVDSEAVNLYVGNRDSLSDPLAVANTVIQADEIPYRSWDDSKDTYSSDEEHLGYQMVDELGGLENMSRDTLENHFDYEQYGRALEQGLYLDNNGYIPATADIDTDYYDAADVADEFGIVEDDLTEEEVEAARRDLKEGDWGISSGVIDEAEPLEVVGCARALEGLSVSEQEAVSLYSKNCLNYFDGVCELANVALQADEIMYTAFDQDIVASDNIERLGIQEFNADEMERDELELYFDYEDYGQSLADDFIFGDAGYLDVCADGPDLTEYSRDDLMEEVGWAVDEELGGDEVGIDAISAAKAAAEIAASVNARDSVAYNDMTR